MRVLKWYLIHTKHLVLKRSDINYQLVQSNVLVQMKFGIKLKKALEEALKSIMVLEFDFQPGEGAFYGPKIEFTLT